MKNYSYVLQRIRDNEVMGAWTTLYSAKYDAAELGCKSDKYQMIRCRGLRTDIMKPSDWEQDNEE